MILDRLVLKNFKRFRDEKICFKDGITGILGNNGTGKSSLVQAIFFALYGVLNGTCNYILTRMAAEGLTYEQALMEAREMGYAEADPTYDVQGIDAAIKLVIDRKSVV